MMPTMTAPKRLFNLPTKIYRTSMPTVKHAALDLDEVMYIAGALDTTRLKRIFSDYLYVFKTPPEGMKIFVTCSKNPVNSQRTLSINLRQRRTCG